MINNKKKINKIKTEAFLNEFPIILLLQHNNFTVKDWLHFRQKIQEFSSIETPIEILNIKNSLLKQILIHEKIIKNQTNKEMINSFCQGPNFILGCKNEHHLNSLWSFINSSSKLIFITCLYNNQLINHLDLQILLKTDSSIYNSLIYNLDKKTELYNTLRQNLQLYPLNRLQYNLINIFQFLKESKK